MMSAVFLLITNNLLSSSIANAMMIRSSLSMAANILSFLLSPRCRLQGVTFASIYATLTEDDISQPIAQSNLQIKLNKHINIIDMVVYKN